jgi:hypothetical protein
MRELQQRRELTANEERMARLGAIQRVEKLQAVVNALGARLARSLDDDRLARLFHEAARLHHEAEMELDRYYPMRQDCAQEQDIAREQAA